MGTYLLMINKDDIAMSWGFISNPLWQIIIKGFLNIQADGIAFDNMMTKYQIERIGGFRTWKPKLNSVVSIHRTYTSRANIQVEKNEKVAIFEYDATIKQLIETVEFREWSVINDEYPIDILFFFAREKLIARAIPYESTIHFFVTEEQKRLLDQLDPLLKRNLHHQEGFTVEVMQVE